MMIAALFLVAFMPLNTVQAIEKQSIETLDCDLINLDVDIEITKADNCEMMVEVEISPGDCNYVNIYDKTNNVNKDIYNYDNPNKEANRFKGTNYLTSCIWQYNNSPKSTNTKPKHFLILDRKLYKDHKGVVIVTGVILGLQHTI